MEKHSIFEKKSVMIIAALVCCLLWGSAFPSVKISYELLDLQNKFQMISFAGLRFTIAGFAVLVFAKAKLKTKIAPTKDELPFILLIALLQTFGAYLLFYIGIANTTGVKASVLITLSTFIVVFLAHFMFKNEKLSWKKVFGLVCGFAGVVIVNISLVDSSFFSFKLSGEGLVALTSIFSAACVVLIRKYPGKVNAVKLNGWQLFIGGLLLFAVGFIGYPQLPSFNVASGALLLYLSTISAVAFTIWFILLQHHKVSKLAQYKFAIPIFGSILSVIFVGERFGLEILAALVLVAIGTLVVNRQSKKDTL